jgi:hypothetical protein
MNHIQFQGCRRVERGLKCRQTPGDEVVDMEAGLQFEYGGEVDTKTIGMAGLSSGLRIDQELIGKLQAGHAECAFCQSPCTFTTGEAQAAPHHNSILDAIL